MGISLLYKHVINNDNLRDFQLRKLDFASIVAVIVLLSLPSFCSLTGMFNSFQGKFKPFYKYAKNFNSDDFDYEALDNSDYVFMRWKVSI